MVPEDMTGASTYAAMVEYNDALASTPRAVALIVTTQSSECAAMIESEGVMASGPSAVATTVTTHGSECAAMVESDDEPAPRAEKQDHMMRGLKSVATEEFAKFNELWL